MAPPADTATIVLGGVIVAICTLAVAVVNELLGTVASVGVSVLVLFLLDKDLSMAAWAFCQWVGGTLRWLVGQAPRELPRDLDA
jgi:hypothetical protein